MCSRRPNHVDTFSSDFAFSFAAYLSRLKADQHFFVYQNILSLIAFIISHRLFADKLVYAPSQFFSGNTDYPVRPVYVTIENLSPLENAAKSRILLACADGRTRQCYLTICAILADYEEQVLLTGVKKNRHCTRCTRTEQFTQLQQERCLNKGHDDFVHPVDCFGWKHHNFNIHVSLATDTLHLLLKSLVIKMLDFMQDITTPVTQESSSTQLNERFRQTGTEQKAIIQQLIAVVSPLFVSKAPFALHFIRAVCDLVTLAQYKSHDEDTLAYIQGALERMNVFKEKFQVYRRTLEEEKNFNYPKALDSICTRANSEAHHITIVKQFYSMTNKKEYILQICLHNSQRTALLAADHATIVKQSQPSTTVSRISVQIHSSIKCWQSSGKRHNDPKHCDKEVVQEFEHRDNRRQSRTVTDGRVVAQLHLILTIIDHTRYDKDRKHIAYIRAFSEVLLFNNNGQIDNTTRMLSVPFKFYDLSTIIRPVHLVPRDLPNLITRTTMSYYVNNYID
ncbi:hypothetical protein HBI88_106410 [Parastagonospora nodorum]|nr:hypothetical protein HBI87_237300 [Parastagonospora nodorum]KAH5922549.1 hypothetical protein HBI86_237990 [Parastagonospora nodorum]KAH5928105.1 hypothetical protein HBI88_106410 [Parastagonospora nodorum]KAH5954067.1 hypothetical protein HBI85_216030 [Parastagonospora nodorum]